MIEPQNNKKDLDLNEVFYLSNSELNQSLSPIIEQEKDKKKINYKKIISSTPSFIVSILLFLSSITLISLTTTNVIDLKTIEEIIEYLEIID